MTLHKLLDAVEERGRGMALFCSLVRQRGGRAVVEEDVDLPVLRSLYLALRRALSGPSQERPS